MTEYKSRNKLKVSCEGWQLIVVGMARKLRNSRGVYFLGVGSKDLRLSEEGWLMGG